MDKPASTRQLKVARELQRDLAEIIRSKGMAVFAGAALLRVFMAARTGAGSRAVLVLLIQTAVNTGEKSKTPLTRNLRHQNQTRKMIRIITTTGVNSKSRLTRSQHQNPNRSMNPKTTEENTTITGESCLTLK